MTVPAEALPPGWRAAALDPPCALGGPALRGTLKAEPADFIVEEQLGFAPDGGPAHVLLRVEKTATDTLAVARALARHADVPARDVGIAGLKDRQAVATQWFSVPASPGERCWTGFRGPGYAVLEAQPHSRKLRRGALAGNRFRIRVRQAVGAAAQAEARLAAVAERGVPNYFGAQRFGAGGSNLLRVARWLADGRLPRSREQRSFTLSAARSLAFNGVLAARVRAGHWDRLLAGDVLNLDGTGSVFRDDQGAGLPDRVARGDLHPTGPLPGRGGMAPAGAAGELESAALAPFVGLIEALAAAGVEAERRALRVLPREFEWTWRNSELALGFLLPRGTFATAVLREIVAGDREDGVAAACGLDRLDRTGPAASGVADR